MAQKFDEIGETRLKDPLSYISKDVKSSLFLFIPNAHEISKIIAKLDENKQFGYDLISNKMAKVTNEIISPYLEILFHKCIQEGVWPDTFKIAQVIPLFKGGTKKIKTVTGRYHCYQR